MKHLLGFNENNTSSWFDEIDPVFNSARDEDFEVKIRDFKNYMRVIINPIDGQSEAFKRLTKEILYRLSNILPNLTGRIRKDIFHTNASTMDISKLGAKGISQKYTLEELYDCIDNLEQGYQNSFGENDCCFILWIENPNEF